MAYIDKAIIEATEPELIKTFIAQAVAASSKIECSKTASEIDAEYADTSIATSFRLTIDSLYEVDFIRAAANGIAASYYNFVVKKGGTAIYSGFKLEWSSSGMLPNDPGTRILYIKVMDNDALVWFSFGSGKNIACTMPNHTLVVFRCTDGTKGYTAGLWDSPSSVSIPGFFGSAVNFTAAGNGTIQAALTSRFGSAYYDSSQTAAVEVIGNKLYKSEGTLIRTTRGIHDCSLLTAPAYSFVKLSSQGYWVYDSHTIIPC